MRTVGVLLTVMVLVGSGTAYANLCAQAYDTNVNKLTFFASQANTQGDYVIPASEVSKFPRLAEQFDIPHFSRHPGKNIEMLFARLTKEVNETNYISTADEMARFGVEVLSLMKNATRAQQKKVEFGIIEAISKLESFSDKEWVKQERTVFENYPNFNYFEPNQFTKVTKDYLARNDDYQNIQQHTGVIDWADIRDIFSQQKWIVEIKDHDTYHLHYSSGHPYYLTTIFRLAWSRNVKRYYLASSLYEGIDGFQSSIESRIFSYMSKKPEYIVNGKFDLEGAIMYLARAPYHELEKIAKDMRLGETYDGQYNQLKVWQPKVLAYMKSQTTRDMELNKYVSEIQGLVNDPKTDPNLKNYSHSYLQLH